MNCTIAQRKSRAKLLITSPLHLWHHQNMRDWAIDYILHVLEKKDWSANKLAQEARVAASTINRPLRIKDYANKLSRQTITKIQVASGIDPAPFIPAEFAEDAAMFAGRQQTHADRALAKLDQDDPAPNAQSLNEIKIAVVGSVAQIVATVNRDGIAKLRKKLDAIESMIDD